MTTRHTLVSLILVGFSSFAGAQQASPVQSAARPFNLDIVAPVQVAGSDEAASAFQTNVLPGMLALVNQNLGEYQTKNVNAVSSIALDPSRLVLASDSTARVYFVGEGAGYRNTLGLSTTGGGPLSPDAALIFPNASSSSGFAGSGNVLRTSTEPLKPGDFVDLGAFTAGTKLDFFLIANGASGGKEFYSTDQSVNMDGLVHAVSIAPNGSTYLLIGFEDLKNGGDRDFNDLVFAVEFVSKGTQSITGLGAPEPSLAVGALLSAVALLGFSRRRSPR